MVWTRNGALKARGNLTPKRPGLSATRRCNPLVPESRICNTQQAVGYDAPTAC